MTLILLAISGAVVLCVLAWNFAIYALPFMVGLTAFQFVHGTGSGFLMSGLAAIGAALVSIALVIAVIALAKSPALRVAAIGVFAIPAAIAGYALVYGITKNAIDSTIVINLLGGTSGFIVGIAAMINLNALGISILSR